MQIPRSKISVQFWVYPEQYSKIRLASEKLHISLAEFLRRAGEKEANKTLKNGGGEE